MGRSRLGSFLPPVPDPYRQGFVRVGNGGTAREGASWPISRVLSPNGSGGQPFI